MEILACIGTILNWVFCNDMMKESLKEDFKYFKSSKEEVQTLRVRKQDLMAQVNYVEEKLLILEGEGKKRSSLVINWLDKANAAKSKVDEVQTAAEAPNSCLGGVLPNCSSRAKLGKQMLELIEEMTTLVDNGKFSDEELAVFVQERGMEMRTTRLIGSTTAEKNLEMVWECLIGDEFQTIGVYGMGGVGKTTLMKIINNRLLQQQSLFKNVLWVTVSEDVDAQKVQEKIAGVVNLDLSAKPDEARRSSLLQSALRRKGKFVLILDDMWKAFDLQDLGVPEPTKDNGCKVVLTTRSKEVCERMCQKEFKVEHLLTDEAWELFVENVGELVPEVKEIAKEVVAECCGLPLAIVTIGRAMRRKKQVNDWQVALSDLKESTSSNTAMEEKVKVIQRLKFSYDQLKENHQKCFLYCALYPDDYEIDTSKLIEYWVMEGLVEGSSKEDELRRGHFILDTLKHCCMLEEVSLEGRRYEDDRDLVKMHDLIRDMALYITKTKPKFIVRTGLSSTKVPHEDDWSEDLERVSFMQSCIVDISIIPKCPKLSTLIISQSWLNPKLNHVARGFFMHMKSLTVLDLSGTYIESLPDSVSDLVNLRGLLLIDCKKLLRVPSLSKLQSLRVLKLTRSAIEELPHGMEMLVNLRSLDLSYNFKSKEMIPSGLISKFSLLEELNLQDIKPENVYTRERGGDFVQELSSLTQLENLHIAFHELSDFIAYGKFGNFERLKKYFIEMERDQYSSSQHERSLFLSNSKGIPCNALSLPKRIQFLQVQEFNQITRLSELALNDSQQDLRQLVIRSCDSIEFIVPEDEEGIFLQRIESMTIRRCQSLSKIYEKVPTHGAFPCLKRLEIWGCGNIKILLSSRLLQQLHNLEEITMWSCAKMEELIVEEEEEEPVEDIGTGIDYTVALPRLKELSFDYLPKLKSIWKGVMICDSLETVFVHNCPELKRLPFFNEEHQSGPPSLKEIAGSREWWDSLEWDYPCPEHLYEADVSYIKEAEWDYPCPEHLFEADVSYIKEADVLNIFDDDDDDDDDDKEEEDDDDDVDKLNYFQNF